jgi:hypothetical protein
MTDNAALMKRADAHARTGKPPAVPAKVRAAVEIMLTTPGEIDYAKLAHQVGYGCARELRRWLGKPQSMRYLQQEKRARLAAIAAANPESLRLVRDTSGNAMARVQAIRTLEAMGERMDEQAGGRAGTPAPGIVIVLEPAYHGGQLPADVPGMAFVPKQPRPAIAAGPVIDVNPIEEGETELR